MSKEVYYYEVTNSYGGIPKGLRFKVEHMRNRHIDSSIKEGIHIETGIELRLINLSMLKCQKI